MNRFFLTFFLLLFFISNRVHCQWQNLNSGINDNLNGIVFLGQNGIVVGEKGVYYTTNYGNGPSNWSRFAITDNPNNSNIYENTVFSHCTSDLSNTTDSGIIYVSGQNTINNSPILFRIDIPSLNYEIIYQGPINSVLNQLAYRNSDGFVYAVGSQGILLRIQGNTVQQISTNMVEDNLKALAFYSNNYIHIASDTKIGTASLNNNATTITFSVTETPGLQIEDIDANGSNSSFTVGSNYIYHSNSDLSYRNNFYDQLNANTLIKIGNIHFVGTDHGVLNSSSSKQFLELQPSSSSNNIKSFWKDTNDSNLIYACGENGAILKSTNLGDITIPYINLTGQGSCVNSVSRIHYYPGSSNNCNWTINGNSISNDCSNLDHFFNTAGTYEVSVNATNSSGGQATVSTTIHITDPPEINKKITVNDLILCKEEPITIEIENSEPNVRYVLKKDEIFNNTIFGVSPEGNGGTIILNSDVINETGEYYLIAESTLANCSRSFTDRIHIEVEKTKANFVASLINAEVNEPTTFSETSVDAQNFSWNFDSNPSNQISSLDNPVISFSELGATSVDLEVWSDHGCYDNTTLPGPFIYAPPTNQEPSWTILYPGEDLYNGQIRPNESPGGYSPEIIDMTELSDGFLTYGYYNNLTFQSKIGANVDFQEKSGGYLAKHNFEGVLKWLVYSPGSQSKRSFVHDAVEDSKGNIYLCGFTYNSFYDNHGNEINFEESALELGYIIKLDAKGRYLWRVFINDYYPKRLTIDSSDNLISIGGSYSYSTNTLYLNGQATTDEIATTIHSPGTGYSLVKLSPEGSLIWDADISGTFHYDINIDSNDNIYLASEFSSRIQAYSANNTNPVRLAGNFAKQVAISKYNKDGNVQWSVKNSTVNNGGGGSTTTTVFDMYTDEQGNSYIAGRNSTDNTNSTHIFYNSDNTTTKLSVGELYLAKINTNGICEWINGGEYSYYGFGYKLDKKDNIVYLAGRYANNDNTPEEAYFTSANGEGHNLTLSASDYFISSYDPNGNLIKIITNGSNNDDLFYESCIAGFFKDRNSDSFYIAQTLGYFINSSGFQNFGHIIPPTNGSDVVLSKVSVSDGITHFDNSTLSIPDVSLSTTNFEIFPNPVNTILNIKSKKEPKEISVLNSLGQTILQKQKAKEIDVSALNSGLFFIRVTYEDEKSITKKIIKK